MVNPRQPHLDTAYRLFRYIKQSLSQGILLSSSNTLQIHAFCDSDWATCPETYCSITRYYILLGSSPISWKYKKQHTISHLSIEVGYRVMVTTSYEIQCLISLLHDLQVTHSQPATMFCDNNVALHIAANPVFHELTKHIKIDCHVICERVQASLVQIAYIHTKDQLTDVFTKALGATVFPSLIHTLGVHNLHTPTQGEVLGNP